MRSLLFLLIALFVLFTPIHSRVYDLDKTGKTGGKISDLNCNKDTMIDFYFSPDTTISACTVNNNGLCSTTGGQKTTLKFLDKAGVQSVYTLQNVEVYQLDTPLSSRGILQQKGAFIFSFSNSKIGKNVKIAVPFSNGLSTSKAAYQLDLSSFNYGALNTFKTTGAATINAGFALSPFNYLNTMDLGHFYHITDGPVSNTYLLSYFILSNSGIDPTTLNAYSAGTQFVPDVFNSFETGDKLCYGSGTQGIFQTHLRESYPLWTAMIGILFYWIYLLVTQANQINCYDKKFQDNKWTCWGFYSLHYLGHQDYFTKLSRTTQMLITFSWQGCVIAILYHGVPVGSAGSGSVMILWAALVAVVTAQPFTYIMGHVFLKNIYSLTLRKYETLKKMKGVFNKKDGLEGYEKQIDDIEESLYGYYYWFYVLAFCFFTAFWTISVHEMQMVARQYYYFMYYFLASIAVALGFEHLFFDPILTYFFGNFSFYRSRGFYYDFRLGERFKEIEQ